MNPRLLIYLGFTVCFLSFAKADSIPDHFPYLAKKWLFNELEKASVKEPLDLHSDSLFIPLPGRIVGYIRNFKGHSDVSSGLTFTHNEITREEQPCVVHLFPDGRFEVDIPMLYPYQTYFSVGRKNFPFYLEPGQTLGMYIDYADFSLGNEDPANILYFGPLGRINRELNQFRPERKYAPGHSQTAVSQPAEEVVKKETEVFRANLASLEQFVQTHRISPKAALILQLTEQLQYGYSLLEYLDRREYICQSDTTGNPYLRSPLPGGFYDFLYDLPLDRPYLLCSNASRSFLNRLEFSYPFRGEQTSVLNYMYSTGFYEKSFPEFLFEKGISWDDRETAYVQFADSLNRDPFAVLSRNSQERLHKMVRADLQFSRKYGDYFREWNEKYKIPTFTRAEIQKKEWELTDYLLAEKFRFDRPLAFEILRLRTISLSGKPDFEDLSPQEGEALYEALQKELTHPVVKQEANRLFRQYTAKDEFQVVPLPEGKGKEVFNRIIRNHPGKILFVDFWATWCGPCLGTIESNKTYRTKYENNPEFEFIFITDESSPENAYHTIVREQELTHSYRISTTDFNHLKETFKFHAIPYYVVVNKDGELIRKNFRMEHFETSAWFVPGITCLDIGKTEKKE